jgi:hypothetical protein
MRNKKGVSKPLHHAYSKQRQMDLFEKNAEDSTVPFLNFSTMSNQFHKSNCEFAIDSNLMLWKVRGSRQAKTADNGQLRIANHVAVKFENPTVACENRYPLLTPLACFLCWKWTFSKLERNRIPGTSAKSHMCGSNTKIAPDPQPDFS